MATRPVRIPIISDYDPRGTRAAERDLARLDKSGAASLDRLKTAAKVASAALAGLALTKAVGEIVGFDKAMRNVNSIAQQSERNFGRLSDQVLKLAGKTAQAPVTLAEGLYDLVSSGFDAKEALSILESAAKAATAGLTTTEVSTKAVAAVLNAYKRPATDAAEVSDALFRTVDRGVISFEDLAQNIGDVLPFAQELDVGIEQVGAAIATMTKNGIPAAEAVTFLKGSLAALLKPSADMKAALKELGVATGGELIEKTGSLQAALDALQGTTKGNKEQFQKLFPDLRGASAALSLTGSNARGAADDLEGLRDSAGATDRALSQQSKSISFAWNKLKAQVSAFAIDVGSVAVPAVVAALGQIGPAADRVAGVFQDIGASGVAMAALGAIVGGLTGRLVGLGAAFAVSKLIAFIGFVRDVGVGLTSLATVADIAKTKIRGLNLATATTGIGALAVVLGTVAGALLGYKNRTDEATISQRELASSVREFHSALDSIAGAHLEARQAKLNERAAELELSAAYRERRDLIAQGITQGPQWEQLQLRIANAKVNEERATRAANTANRDWNDTVTENSATANSHIGKLTQLRDRARDHRDEVKREVDKLRDRVLAMQEQGRSADELRPHLERLRDKERELRDASDKAKGAQRDLTDAQRDFRGTVRKATDAVDGLINKYTDLTKLRPAQLKIVASLAFSGGFPEFQKPEDLLRGGSGGTDLRGPVLDGATAHANKQVRNGAAGGALGGLIGGGGGDGRFSGLNRVAGGFGLGVTSGFRQGDPGWHGKNRARDYGGAAAKMLAFARLVGSTLGPRLLELIHSPLGWGIKNGKRVSAGYFGKDVYADHFDHVHVAMQRGGPVPGSGVGDKVRALLEPGEFVMNRRAVAAMGPGFFRQINDRIARFQSGGMVGIGGLVDLAQRAGFRGTGAARMAAEAMAESSGRVNARGDGGKSHGLWQIHTPSWPDLARRFNLFSPWGNAQAARQVFLRSGRSFSPWHANHRPHMAAALQALRGGSRGGGGAGGGGGALLDSPAPGFIGPGIVGGGRADADPVGPGSGGFTPQLGAPVEKSGPATPVEPPPPPTAQDFGNRDLALAQLTDTLDDDLAALRTLEGLAQQQLDAALLTADPRDDIEAAGLLRGIRDQIKGLDDTIARQQEAERERLQILKQLGDELKRQNDFAASVVAITGREAVRALADMISGEIVGRGIVPRAATAGHGSVAAF